MPTLFFFWLCVCKDSEKSYLREDKLSVISSRPFFMNFTWPRCGCCFMIKHSEQELQFIYYLVSNRVEVHFTDCWWLRTSIHYLCSTGTFAHSWAVLWNSWTILCPVFLFLFPAKLESEDSIVCFFFAKAHQEQTELMNKCWHSKLSIFYCFFLFLSFPLSVSILKPSPCIKHICQFPIY